VNGFIHPLPEWSTHTINLLLDKLVSGMEADHDDASLWSDDCPPLPLADYKVLPTHLVTRRYTGHVCLPRSQSIIKATIKCFLDGDFSFRVSDERVRQSDAEHSRQVSAALQRQRDEEKEQRAVARFEWRQELLIVKSRTSSWCRYDSSATAP
jgi:hypothetical protein